MALRFCLVCLVVTLGLELPRDVSGSVQGGWNWVFGESEVGSAVVGTDASTAPTPADIEFAGIVDRMANTFGAELARTERSAQVVERPEIEVEEWSFESLEATKPVVATSIRRESRMISAIKLTHQAASAWAEVFASLEESPPVPSPEAASGEASNVGESTTESLARFPGPAVTR